MMRKIRGDIFFLFALSALFILMGCDAGQAYKEEQKKETRAIGNFLDGEHKLHRFIERTETSGMVSGGFFLITGSITLSTQTRTVVKFAWEMNDGIYAISSLPLEVIRVKFDDKAITPTIRFEYRKNLSYAIHDIKDIQPSDLMKDVVVYALVTVREEDWPAQVKLPL